MKKYDIYLNNELVKTVTATDKDRPNDLLKKLYPKTYSCLKIRPHLTPMPTPEWWNDLYTDAAGNCFSDADPGL